MADDPTVTAGDPVPGQAGNEPEPKEPDPKEPDPKEPEPTNDPKEPQKGEPTEPKEPREPGDDPPKDADWRASIEDPKLREFASRFESPSDVAKTAFEFRQKLSNAISLPGKKATDEEIAEFNKKLGVPESADGYEIKLPELPEGVDEERLSEGMSDFRARMHKVGARPEQVQAVVDWYFDTVNTAIEQQDKAVEESFEEAEATLRKEWSDDYDANLEHAKRAVKQFGDEDFQALVDEDGAKIDGKPVGNHPAFLKAFAKIGRRIGEGGLQIAMGEDEKQSTQQKLDDLTAEAMDAMNSGDKSKADRLFKERDELSRKFYGEE